MTEAARKAINRFRGVAIAEGISYVVLLFIAMPLKYAADMPWAVKYVGWAHGVLFVLYMLTLLPSSAQANWSLKKTAWAFIASLLPFGTFFLDKQLKQELNKA